VMVFHLLMEGVHPYAGVWHGRGDPPTLEQRIQSGDCPYVGSTNVSPMPVAVSFDILPASLKSLIVRCFGYGHRSPQTRPSAHEWREALNAVEGNLNTCSANRRHVYADHLSACPWCERTVVLSGFDPFPSASKQQPLTAAPFVATPQRPIRVAMPLPPGPASPGPPTAPAFQQVHQPGTIRARTPISIWSVIGAGIIGSLLLGSSGSTVLFLSRMSNTAARYSMRPFAGAFDNPFWMIGLFAGVAFRLLSRVSRRTAVFGTTVIVLFGIVWYSGQPAAISFAPSSSPPPSTAGEQRPVSVPASASAASQSPPSPSATPVVEPTDTVDPAPAADPIQTPLVPPDVESRASNGLPDSQAAQLPTPMIAAFEAVPTRVEQCAVAILRWTVQGASSVSIEPGIGVVNAASGYKVVRPVQTSRYTLKAEGPGGSISRDVTLAVASGTRANCSQ
jgi:hypothetical protein